MGASATKCGQFGHIGSLTSAEDMHMLPVLDSRFSTSPMEGCPISMKDEGSEGKWKNSIALTWTHREERFRRVNHTADFSKTVNNRIGVLILDVRGWNT